MKEKILSILEATVAIDSTTFNKKEKDIESYLETYLQGLPYFKENPEQTGLIPIAGDPLGRGIVYGLVKGDVKAADDVKAGDDVKTAGDVKASGVKTVGETAVGNERTVIYLNHHDTVGITDYGDLGGNAFKPSEIAEILKQSDIDEDTRNDLESGEWIFGRGSCDMKGGLAIELALLEQYSESAKKPGSLLFLSIPDEESFSAGMRGALPLLEDLRQRFNLSYSFLINMEPGCRDGIRQVFSIGTVGKLLPVVLAQGRGSHIYQYFDGINSLSLISDIFRKTEGNLEICETLGEEKTIPPAWSSLRDLKTGYDVSLPRRSYGYFTLQNFRRTPEEVMKLLKRITEESCDVTMGFRAVRASAYSGGDNANSQVIMVMEFKELFRIAGHKEGFTDYYRALHNEIASDIKENKFNYPDATVKIMNSVLDYSGITDPIVILAFAPPYYPSLHSPNLQLKMTEDCTDFVKHYGREYLGLEMVHENYFLGISDCSYCGIDHTFNEDTLTQNMPIWGDLYSFDFDVLRELNIPFFLLGPWGKDLHMRTERVNIKSLTEEMPAMIRSLTGYIWKEQ